MLLLHISQDGWLDALARIDTDLFIKINRDWASSFFDTVLPIVRDQRTWYPLYALLLVYLVYKLRWKCLPFVLLAAATAGLGDQLSSSLLKELIGRIRPCRAEELEGIMTLRVGYCPRSGSFTSSHAVNHFALAAFFYFGLRNYLGKGSLLFFLWAAVICYAQVYVGVHYPGDVAGGSVLGILLGIFMSRLFRYYFNFGSPLSARRT
jgi:membrane-associated phospholipid phosphatase